MIPIKDFEKYAPTSVGEQVNINHDNCPAGRDTRRRLYIKRTKDAVLAYCHNCNGHRVHCTTTAIRPMALLEKLVRESGDAELVQKEVVLPEDSTHLLADWPAAALSWLYQHGISNDDIRNNNIVWSPSWARVILPVYDGGKLVFWQGRRIEGDGPKYISVRSARKPLFTAMANHTSPAHLTKTVVLTEDYLSALRVAKSGVADAVALLGTHGPDDLPERLRGYEKILIWLDHDLAGRIKATPLATRLRTATRAVVGLAAASEPKLHPDKEIYAAVINATYK